MKYQLEVYKPGLLRLLLFPISTFNSRLPPILFTRRRKRKQVRLPRAQPLYLYHRWVIQQILPFRKHVKFQIQELRILAAFRALGTIVCIVSMKWDGFSNHKLIQQILPKVLLVRKGTPLSAQSFLESTAKKKNHETITATIHKYHPKQKMNSTTWQMPICRNCRK